MFADFAQAEFVAFEIAAGAEGDLERARGGATSSRFGGGFVLYRLRRLVGRVGSRTVVCAVMCTILCVVAYTVLCSRRGRAHRLRLRGGRFLTAPQVRLSRHLRCRHLAVRLQRGGRLLISFILRSIHVLLRLLLLVVLPVCPGVGGFGFG